MSKRRGSMQRVGYWAAGIGTLFLLTACSADPPAPIRGRFVGVVSDCAGNPVARLPFEIVPEDIQPGHLYDDVAWETGDEGQIASRPLPFGTYEVVLGDAASAEATRVPVTIDQAYSPESPDSAMEINFTFAPGGQPACSDSVAAQPD